MERFNKCERGSIIIIVALGMTFFIGMLGLVVDGGYLYLQRALLSNATDAAALAGVQDLPSSWQVAETRAYQYGVANKMETHELEVGFANNFHRIIVTAQRDVPLFFLQILGFSDVTVQAQAAAEVGQLSGYAGVAPFGIVWEDFSVNQTYYLKTDPHTGGSLQGNFGALALGGRGANNYENNIKHGYNGMLRVGDKVLTETGNIAGPTKRGVEFRLNGSPRIVIPVIDSLDVTGRDYVTILGFAVFDLEDVETYGSDAAVIGKFVFDSVDGILGVAPDYGATAYRLVH